MIEKYMSYDFFLAGNINCEFAHSTSSFKVFFHHVLEIFAVSKFAFKSKYCKIIIKCAELISL